MIDTTLTNLLFLVFGAVSAWLGWRTLQHARVSTTWPRVHGEIIASREEVTHNGEYETRRGVITYHYRVDGTPYRSRRVFFGDTIGLLWDKPRERRLAAYPVGRAVQVAYDPAAPHQAVLEAGPHGATYLAVAAPAALALYGLAKLLSG